MQALKILQSLIEFKIEALKDYAKEIENSLQEKQAELHSEFKKELDEVTDDDERQRMIDWFLDDNLKFYDDFPKMQRDALFLISYSFFELSLARICQMVIRDAKTKKLTLTPPTKVYAYASKKFLDNVANVKIKRKENLWKKLNQLREYRNFIAHNGSNLQLINDKADKVKKITSIKYINKYIVKEAIKNDRLKQYHIEKKELLEKFIDLIENYLQFVITQSIKKYKVKAKKIVLKRKPA